MELFFSKVYLSGISSGPANKRQIKVLNALNREGGEETGFMGNVVLIVSNCSNNNAVRETEVANVCHGVNCSRSFSPTQINVNC